MTDPTYVDDPFGDDSWKQSDTDMQRALLQAGLRKFFKAGEKQKFIQVEKRMHVWKSSDQVFDLKGKLLFYPTQYVLDTINWAKTKNDKSGRPVIQVPTIIKMIKDTDKIAKWLGFQKKDKEEDRSGYTDTGDEW